ncbi:hypothetical protein ABIC08_008256 [Bradyrhizobium sp. RT9b]
MPSDLQAAAAPVDIARTGAQELRYIADVSAASQPILLFSKRRPGTNKPASSLLFLQQPWPPAPAHRGKPHSPRVQLRCHFARMSGMDAIVTPPGGHQDRWIGLPGSCAIVGRIGFQPLPIRSVVGIAIFGEPARPREQSDAAAHVDQRDGAEQCAEALGISRSYVGDEDAAVRSTLGCDPLGLCHAALCKFGGDGCASSCDNLSPASRPASCQRVPNSPPPRKIA